MGHTSMSYVHFTRDVELIHRVTIVGWTADRFCNPSDLSNNITELTKLRDALKNGSCKFVKLTDEQYNQVKKKYDEQVAAGVFADRKKRKDIGTKRKKTAVQEGEGVGGEGVGGEDEDEGGNGEGSGTSKRARVSDGATNSVATT